MTGYMVDTNVAMAANGRNTHADLACQYDCIEKLEAICHEAIVVLDEGDLIFEEYRSRLCFEGAPGTGDKFFKHVHDYRYGESRVKRVPITPCSDEMRGFEELPENELDALTSDLGVRVRQLCPQHARRSATQP